MTDTAQQNTDRWDAIAQRLNSLDGLTEVAATPVVSIQMTNVVHNEGGPGTNSLYTFTVTKSGDLSLASTFNWAVTGAGISPVQTADFPGGVFPTGTGVSIGIGIASVDISFYVLGDLVVEPDEHGTITISSVTNAVIGNAACGFAILNDDAAGAWPENEFDARFANNTQYILPVSPSPEDISGRVVRNRTTRGYGKGQSWFGYGDYQVINSCMIDGGEGPRCSGPNILIDGCYIRINATDPLDHGDGFQAYNNWQIVPNADWKNIVIRNTKIEMRGYTNAGIFSADKAGISLTLENVKVVCNAYSPHGCIFLPNAPIGTNGPNDRDTGLRAISMNNVVCESNNGLFITGGYMGGDSLVPVILQWLNVRTSKNVPIPATVLTAG